MEIINIKARDIIMTINLLKSLGKYNPKEKMESWIDNYILECMCVNAYWNYYDAIYKGGW